MLLWSWLEEAGSISSAHSRNLQESKPPPDKPKILIQPLKRKKRKLKKKCVRDTKMGGLGMGDGMERVMMGDEDPRECVLARGNCCK